MLQMQRLAGAQVRPPFIPQPTNRAGLGGGAPVLQAPRHKTANHLWPSGAFQGWRVASSASPSISAAQSQQSCRVMCVCAAKLANTFCSHFTATSYPARQYSSERSESRLRTLSVRENPYRIYSTRDEHYRNRPTASMAEDEVDPSELFSSPIKPSDLPPRPKTPKTPTTPTPTNSKDKQPFDAEEVREAALQRELEGVRNINEVIEGVIGTLERAKGNMGVSLVSMWLSHPTMGTVAVLMTCTECLPNRKQCFHPPQHLDAHPFPDRAQPALDPEQGLERRNQGHGGHRGGEAGAAARRAAPGRGGGTPARGRKARG